MNEASKSLRLYPEIFNKYISDRNLRILDIGAGGDPVTDFAAAWDVDQGNAEHIDELIEQKSWDVVFASHCLEHMADPRDALRRWFSLVRQKGIMIILVPDEQLHEQGFFPSIFNPDHKATFTLINPTTGNRPYSNFVPDLISCLEKDIGEKVHIEYLGLQDANYDHGLIKKFYLARVLYYIYPRLFWKLRSVLEGARLAPIDQTLNKDTVAQICFILSRK